MTNYTADDHKSSDYVWLFKVRLLERLLREQIDALGKTTRLTDQDVQEYRQREARILKISVDLGLRPAPEFSETEDGIDVVMERAS